MYAKVYFLKDVHEALFYTVHWQKKTIMFFEIIDLKPGATSGNSIF